jgi:alpha-glucan,water dikinase
VTEESVGLSIEVSKSIDGYSVVIEGDPNRSDLRIHWAVNEWELAPELSRPPGSVQVDALAVQTPLGPDGRIVIEFPGDSCPSKLVFVVKDGDDWIHNGAGDFVAYLKPPGVDDVIAKVIAAETTYERWSLFDRVNLATGLVDAGIAAGPYGMGFIFTWLRLSSIRQLPWYRGTNYQSKDAAHAQKTLSQKMADLCCSTKDPQCRLFSRLCLGTLPRGGGNGDDIRMGILHIMRDNGIREGHRPGIECNFLESWHQKLHTNTTPEDITICEAYLAFLESGDMGEFWRVAWDNGRVTPESLATMDHPIQATPIHLPQLIGPMKHYLWILKTTHAGADLDVMYEMCRGHMDGELAWMIGDMLSNRNEWWVPGKIVEIRERLAGYWKGTQGCSRDIMLLDIALDSYFRILIERMDKSSLSADDIINLISLVLSNAVISSESDSLECSLKFWGRVFNEEPRWSGVDWAKKALAAADTVAVSLEEFADSIAANVQPHADLFGSKCSIEENYIMNFSEEVVRGQSVAVLGPLLQSISAPFRENAEMGPWEIASSGIAAPRVGTLKYLETLESIQGITIEEPTIYVVDKLTGNEDIPLNVECIITAQSTDVLSHIAIRARAQSVLLATCFDNGTFESIKEFAGSGKAVEVTVDGSGSVSWSGCDLRARVDSASASQKASSTDLDEHSRSIGSITLSDSWVIDSSSFEKTRVGGKALNIRRLSCLASDSGINVPRSVALPYGTYEKVLNDPANAGVKRAIEDLTAALAKSTADSGIPRQVQEIRDAIRSSIKPPAGLLKELATVEWIDADENLFDACKTVWGSVFNDRAWLSRKSMGIADEDLHMSVLIQELVPASYAFVIHTADPLTGNPNTLHGEIVIGMGEALVGNMPGRALSFTVEGDSISVTTYPSKVRCLLCQAPLMARSDSNGEDLEDFAGAGLYSSVPVGKAYESAAVNYANEPLIWDDGFRNEMIQELQKIGRAVEASCDGVPQDIEGVVQVTDGRISAVSVVQTRAQVISVVE